MTRAAVSRAFAVAALAATMTALACGGNKPPVAKPTPPPPPAEGTTAATRPPSPPQPVAEPTVVPPEPIIREGAISSASLDELNKSSPLKPVFFELDSSELSPSSLAVLDANAAMLKRNGSWTVTVEGHCDERGSAEYNLALGERRAAAARTYLVSLGIPADRLRTVSYGKEFPFDPGHEEGAWAKNRRAHFVITAK